MKGSRQRLGQTDSTAASQFILHFRPFSNNYATVPPESEVNKNKWKCTSFKIKSNLPKKKDKMCFIWNAKKAKKRAKSSWSPTLVWTLSTNCDDGSSFIQNLCGCSSFFRCALSVVFVFHLLSSTMCLLSFCCCGTSGSVSRDFVWWEGDVCATHLHLQQTNKEVMVMQNWSFCSWLVNYLDVPFL